MSRIDGREPDAVGPDEAEDRGERSSVRPHASRTAVSPTAHTREKVDICRFYKPHDEAAATSPAGVAREWNTIGGILSGLGTRDSGP